MDSPLSGAKGPGRASMLLSASPVLRTMRSLAGVLVLLGAAACPGAAGAWPIRGLGLDAHGAPRVGATARLIPVISGVVLGPGDRPLAGAAVKLWSGETPVGSRAWRPPALREVESAADGTFTFADLSPHTTQVLLAAELPGFVEAAPPLRVTLPPTAPLRLGSLPRPASPAGSSTSGASPCPGPG
jgi:hypothetical protein